jgi:hypothetical protein
MTYHLRTRIENRRVLIPLNGQSFISINKSFVGSSEINMIKEKFSFGAVVIVGDGGMGKSTSATKIF